MMNRKIFHGGAGIRALMLNLPKKFILLRFLLLTAAVSINAQDIPVEVPINELPGFRDQAIIIHIVSRIIESNQNVVWYAESTKVTLPGHPVGVQLIGSNVIVAIQFIPYLRPNNQSILVLQGQIWISIPNEGISFHTTMQTIPLVFKETIYFFPLGSESPGTDGSHIQIEIVLEQYSERYPDE